MEDNVFIKYSKKVTSGFVSYLKSDKVINKILIIAPKMIKTMSFGIAKDNEIMHMESKCGIS